MQWIEEKRLEMGLQTAATHAKSQIQKLTGKDQLSLKQEFMEWLVVKPEDEEDIEIAWMDHSDWW